ncbi:galactoside 2-alpha-L-fucosyltransferase SEC1 isoform X1 [Octopus bimaculoides]|uniref:L-Fucosyltransferase n=1 Tax=Octopus bimaculoides TaxID=37653 RepID=A0A0L8HQL2_OCTBM|nr:galactoside 2-alpha-L-fucosyltransferase SEC1 isoform X1 [Octopus bimaculoides]|eukprot:XP_014770376.1 PREDICTED: galactoside 2-alpha-L-fucosyltransferase 3-like isoform X1 [Octopus bimaculoides]
MRKYSCCFKKLSKLIPAGFIAFMLISYGFSHKKSVEKSIRCFNLTNESCLRCLPQSARHIVPEKKTLCLNLAGRLGNNLFQIASVFGIARAKDMHFTLKYSPQLNHLKEIFKIESLLVNISCPKYLISDVKHCSFNNVILRYPNDRDYLMFGYFQSWLYFFSVEPEIRTMFTFQSKIRDEAQNILRNITQFHRQRYSLTNNNSMTYIGIHIRRGDFLREKNVKFGYKTAPALYFENAMAYYRKQFTNYIFIVCTDDIEWSTKNLGHKSTYYVHEAFYIDFAVLSMCNHSIISVGSFGWWSAWLANGQTVYYPHPFEKNTRLETKFSSHTRDYFPLDWIPIDI